MTETDPCTSTDEAAIANTFENHEEAVENDTTVGKTETENPLKMTANFDSNVENGRDNEIGNIGWNPNGTKCETDLSENQPTF